MQGLILPVFQTYKLTVFQAYKTTANEDNVTPLLHYTNKPMGQNKKKSRHIKTTDFWNSCRRYSLSTSNVRAAGQAYPMKGIMTGTSDHFYKLNKNG